MAGMLVELLILGLATCAIVEVIHHGSIFATLRLWAETRDDKLGELISCPFCLSHWAGALVVCLWVLSKTIGWGFMVPVYVLATIRTSNIINDVLKRIRVNGGLHDST